MCVPRTYTERSCRPRTRWEAGRGVSDRVGRGHVRNGLSGAGSRRWAWSRMRADLHVRRSPWWPEAMPYPLPPAPGQDPGLVLGGVFFDEGGMLSWWWVHATGKPHCSLSPGPWACLWAASPTPQSPYLQWFWFLNTEYSPSHCLGLLSIVRSWQVPNEYLLKTLP